jgi:outer membrane protein assembly factor BamD (BamD/ComL family)
MSNKILLLALFLVTALADQNLFSIDLFSNSPAANKDQVVVIKKLKKKRKNKRREKYLERKKQAEDKKQTGLISKSIREQDACELKHNLEIYLKYNNYDLAIKYIEMLIAKVTDFVVIRDYRLQLADLCFKTEKYQKAGSVYTEYYESYPGDANAEYALSQAILSKYKQVRACDQDNVVTQEVIDLSKQYLQNKSYQKYQKQILELFDACSYQLFESEVKVFEHYFKQGNLKSAQRRLDYMIEKILPKLPNTKEKIDGLKDLMEQAKQGKNPFKILKSFNREWDKNHKTA